MIDPLTGYPLKLDQKEAPVEWLPEMTFWVQLDRELIGARNENGFLKPSEVEAALDRWGIFDVDNRSTARLMLDCLAGGRNRAAMEKLESDDPTGEKKAENERRGKQLRPVPSRSHRER